MKPVYSYKVLQTYASRLYRQAWTTAVVHAIVAGFLGWAIGWALVEYHVAYVITGSVTAPITGLAGAVLGGLAGWEKALEIRAKAQLYLCYAQIEDNTRRLLGASRQTVADSAVAATARA